MWTCDQLKKKGWANISPNYGWALLVVFLSLLLTGTVSAVISVFAQIVSSVNWIFTGLVSLLTQSSYMNVEFGEVIFVVIMFLLSGIIITVIYLAPILFVYNPIQYGLTNWYMTQSREPSYSRIDAMFAGFRKGSFVRVVKGMAWRTLWLTIWSLVGSLIFLIPAVCSLALIFGYRDNATVFSGNIDQNGVIAILVLLVVSFYLIAMCAYFLLITNRFYAYFYVPFLLADDPDLRWREALRKSIRVASGQKGRMCILDLSFIGWWLLCALTCGLGTVFLLPYVLSTKAELFYTRKEECISGETW